MVSTVLIASLTGLARGQTCENYGFINGSTCACPTGFGGSDCSQPACGGDLFQGSTRPVASPQPGSSFANLTAAGCSCESGWTGTTCSVCQTSDACLDAFNAAAGSSNAILGMTGLNNTMVCSNSARVWAAGQMSCQVNVSRSVSGYLKMVLMLSESYTSSHLPLDLDSEHHSHSPTRPLPSTECILIWGRWLALRPAILCRD